MTRKKKKRASLQEAYAHALAMLASRPDVTGVDIGPKYEGGKPTAKQVIRVHVVEKLRGKRLTDSERIPENFLGVPSDVIVANYRRHADAPLPSARFDPIRPGISVGNPGAKSGTLGLIVFDEATGDPCILSAHHVLAGPGAAKGDPITQPARFDHGTPGKDTVATLWRFFAPGLWGDAALAKLTGKRRFSPGALGSGVVVDRVGLPQINQHVVKTGRTTLTTRGRIEGIGTYFYPDLPGGVNGFRVVPHRDDPRKFDLCAPGDSGSVYYAEGTTAGIGLHCAGGNDPALGEIGIACMLATVLATLGVSLTRP